MTRLHERHARPGRPPKLSAEEIASLRAEVAGWDVVTESGMDQLRREVKLSDFKAAMELVHRVATVAEAENHHPDIAIHYNRVTLTLWTHVSHGLTENDFILAARIDRLLDG
jgi:4a-hydroxytetrahydrobiopterin dehydratase